jgi:transposase-like protein/DDE family transposase
MTTQLDGAPSFGATHFGAAKLNDSRRTQRLVLAADAIMQHPGGTLPAKITNPNDLDALYRLANRKEVTHAAVLETHVRYTIQQMVEAGAPILLIHDTTELDYTNITSLTNLGQIGNGNRRGYNCHNTLAVNADTREVIGLASQILARRDTVPKNESRKAKRARNTRESRLWKQGSEAVGPAPQAAMWIDICDRGADVLEYLSYKHQSSGHFIVRSKHDRCCLVDKEDGATRHKLHEQARGLAALGCKTVKVQARDGHSARLAQVEIGAGSVRIIAPKQPRGEHGTEPLLVNVVIVREIDTPAGVEALEWILLTDLPASNLAEATQIVEWYSYRWIVEEFHKAMKTGCGVENLQFTTEAALQPVIALLSVVAVFLLKLRDAGRDPKTAARLATDLVSLEYVKILSVWHHGEVRVAWTVKEFYWALGRLGGHQNRKNGPAPGWLVLWRGWMALVLMVKGASIGRRT